MRTNEKKYLKLWIYISVILLVVLYLCFSNRIVGYLASTDKLLKVEWNTLKTTEIGLYSVDGFDDFGDTFNRINLRGWMFCEAQEQSDSKVIAAVLKSENGVYMAKGNVGFAPDVQVVYGDEYQIAGNMNRYEIEFSTLGLPDGIYDLYLFCQENDSVSRLENLYKRFVKSKGDFRQLISASKVKQLEGEYDNRIEAAMTFQGTADGRMIGNGWAYLKDESCDDQMSYLNIKQNEKVIATYLLPPVLRGDVSDAFQNPKYLYSGYSFDIPIVDLSEGTYEMHIIIYKDGFFYESKPLEYCTVDQNSRSWGKPLTLEKVEPITDVVTNKMLGDFSFETIKDGRLIHKGWIAIEGKDCNNQTVFLNLLQGDRVVASYLLPSQIRTDVVEYMQDEKYLKSGFLLDIAQEDLSEGAYDLEIGLYQDGIYYVSGIRQYYKIESKDV